MKHCRGEEGERQAFCTELVKVYVAKMSCNQLLLID